MGSATDEESIMDQNEPASIVKDICFSRINVTRKRVEVVEWADQAKFERLNELYLCPSLP